MPFCRLASNNFLSEKFSIARNTRQGDLLFPTIFILCIEYLANTLRDNPLLIGFKIVFADDTLIFLHGLENRFQSVLDVF